MISNDKGVAKGGEKKMTGNPGTKDRNRVSKWAPFFWTSIFVPFSSIFGPSVAAERTKEFEVKVSVVASLADYYAVDCVQIFRTDDLPFGEREVLHGTLKGLTAAGAKVTTGIYTFERYAMRRRRQLRKVSCYRSLKIMTADDDSSQAYANLIEEFAIKDAVWVVFSKTLSSDFFESAPVTFDDIILIAVVDSEDLVWFYEVYRITRNSTLKVALLGKWTKKDGLSFPVENIYDRRSDLEGITLKTASLENWPATYTKNGTWEGFLVKIWNEIKSLINCTSISVRVADEVIGMRENNGSWNGMVGMALRGEVDVLLSEIVIDKERSHVLKFFYPIMKTRFQIYTRHLGYEWQWSAITTPFHASVWLAVLAWVLVGAAAFGATHRFCVSCGLESHDPADSFLMPEALFFVIQALCQQGRHATPKSTACRLLFFLSFAVSGVLIPSYSASLVSILTQKIQYKSFDSFEDLVADGSYHLILQENSAQHAFLAHAKDDFLKKAYEKLAKNVPEEQKKMSLGKSLAALCHIPKLAVMGVEEIVDVRMAKMKKPDCTIVPLKNPMKIIHLTMATSKSSPFWGVINHQLEKLLFNGVIVRLKFQEFPPSGGAAVKAYQDVGLQDLPSAFVLIAVSAIASGFILVAEIRHHLRAAARKESKRKRRILHQMKSSKVGRFRKFLKKFPSRI